MGINFDGLGNTLSQSTPVADNASNNGGITLDLKKNIVLDLTKRNPGLKKIIIAIGWDMAIQGTSADLDLSGFLLRNGKLISAEDVIYFHNRNANGISLSEDNRTGAGDGDDEKLFVELGKVDSDVTEIAFCVDIHESEEKGQTFGHIKNAYVRLINEDTNQEVCRFSLNTEYSTDTAIIFTKLKRNGNEWEYETIGEGKRADLQVLANYFQCQ